MFTSRTIFGLLAFAAFASAYHYETFVEKDGFPAAAYSEEFNGVEYFFCEVEAFGKTWTGVADNVTKHCQVINVKNKKIVPDQSFKVLVLDENEVAHEHYVDHIENEIPKNAVKCRDAETKQCYIGHSLASDGICEGSMGKIDLERRGVFYYIFDDIESCPFGEFLVIERKGKETTNN